MQKKLINRNSSKVKTLLYFTLLYRSNKAKSSIDLQREFIKFYIPFCSKFCADSEYIIIYHGQGSPRTLKRDLSRYFSENLIIRKR